MSLLSPVRRRLLCAAAAATVAFTLAACGETKPAFKGSDITGTQLGKGLDLVDHNGTPRKLSDFSGKALVVFFGFTQCPDVCPTALAELAQVMEKLGPDADRVQVMLVSVDPERDTADILKQYVTTFDSRFLGLTGTPEQVRKTAGSFKAYYAKVPSKDGSTYTMDHSAGFYLFDTKGDSRVLANSTIGVDAVAHDLKLLLDAK
ncbi:SCO family protein [Bordetella genomosp. 5]|uniref:SCO family protein n=1 Tax=Bordetella genomosp. 5 TaxID=1395608 RepID=A0A261TZT3_9BORD|nr:SCO family protein [Bordetella genomosp. 5]OZI55196.1 SCO family protein [Bordetella genomosp. 5]